MNDCIGIINLDENESKMSDLVKNRPLASVPLAARYRIIDFVLSNMTNTGMDSIGIFTKNKSRSLVDHLTNGRPWDLHRKKHGLRVFNFGDKDPQYDDIYNFADNIEFLTKCRKEYVIIAPSYMICNIDYKGLIKYHKEQDNDITMVYKNITNGDSNFIECDILNILGNGRVQSIGRNIGRESHLNISMEMYIMRTDLLIEIIYECIRQGVHRKIKSYVSSNLDNLKVGSYEFKGYLSCINSLRAYYKTNMDLLVPEVYEELFLGDRPIYTKSKDEGPTHYADGSVVKNSVIANGSYIEGTVENCIIGRRVYVSPGAVVRNCVIMQEAVIGDNAQVDRVIADKASIIREEEKVIGLEMYPVVIKKPNFL